MMQMGTSSFCRAEIATKLLMGTCSKCYTYNPF